MKYQYLVPLSAIAVILGWIAWRFIARMTRLHAHAGAAERFLAAWHKRDEQQLIASLTPRIALDGEALDAPEAARQLVRRARKGRLPQTTRIDRIQPFRELSSTNLLPASITPPPLDADTLVALLRDDDDAFLALLTLATHAGQWRIAALHTPREPQPLLELAT